MYQNDRALPYDGRSYEAYLPVGGEVTSSGVFWNRRQLLRGLGLTGIGMALAACEGPSRPSTSGPDTAEVLDEGRLPEEHLVFAPRTRDYLPQGLPVRAPTDPRLAAHHNNFYEFLPGRGGDVEPLVEDFRIRPWSLEVKGLCERPRRFDLDDLYAFAQQERLYHFRCVERWAMNVPWIGFPLRQLLELIEPHPEARWVTFVSAADPSTMPGLKATPHYPWPYHEALRIDEALHDLTLLATGVYGAPLPKQHGAPVRLVVPWKYGYKSAKSLVSIELTREPPKTFWSSYAPHEYGLLSNVNPNIPHPRWNQYHSFWLRDDPVWPTGEDIFPTALFNGYEAEVGPLYPDEPRSPQPPLKAGEVAR